MDKQLPTLYENSGYQFERRERKTLILDIEDNTSAKGGSSTCLSGNDQLFAVELHEPLRIDKLSDIYLESFITFNCFRPNCTTSPVGGKMAFIVDIDQFTINSNSNLDSTKDSKLFNKIIIPNEVTNGTSVNEKNTSKLASHPNNGKSHKSKKLNYICSINPETITKITGKITDLNKKAMFDNGDNDDTTDDDDDIKDYTKPRAILEFLIISRD
tara:strand:- start:41 stop:682 length:642 start_codon:yes stop_codon:yes gene_type:complete